MPGIKSYKASSWHDEAVAGTLNPKDVPKFRRPVSYRMSSLRATLRRRTLDEFPMEHNWADMARMSAKRRQEKDVTKQRLVLTHGESNELKSYSRRRFETALNGSGKSLPPPSPEDKRIFWDEVKPTWTHRRHHSAREYETCKKPSSQLVNNRPGSEPNRPVVVRGQRGTGCAIRFNHLRGNNNMYPTIKRLLQESNMEYRVISGLPNANGDFRTPRDLPVDYYDGTECYLIPKKDFQVEMNDDEKVLEKTGENTKHMAPQEDVSEHIDSVDGSAEYIGNAGSFHDLAKAQENTPQKEINSNETETDEVEPSVPWRCWVDDATVSSISPDPETLNLPEDIVSPSPSQAAEDPAPDVSGPPADSVVDVAAPKSNLSVPIKPSRASIASLEKRESATSPVPEVPVGKRKSSGRLRKKKGRKGTPEPPPVEVVELPPPPPPPPTPPVEIVEEEPKEEEKEVELVLPSYICPNSIAKSTEVEIKLWLKKSTFTGANRTVPILF